ncbi:MAG: acyltransferase [Lachnospiraceae bacterium]|nr:acyltransferase [Lachnospiraceae bacterium]
MHTVETPYLANKNLQNHTSHNNNFTIIRMIATAFVFIGHMGMIQSGTPLLFGSYSLHELGVGILFLISGYLITKSWLSDPHPLRYAIRRFFRLWPPFAVMILVMVFITGSLLSDLGIQGYFSSTYTTYLRNLRFFIVYAQPGVFSNNLLANTTNGSLWTMPVEAAAYVLTPILVTVLRMQHHDNSHSQFTNCSFYAAAIITAAAVGCDLYLRVFRADTLVVFYGTDLIAAWHLITMYIIGTFFTYDQIRKYLNLQTALVAMCVPLIFQSSGVFLQYLSLYIILPYFIFSFAFAPQAKFGNIGRKLEPSYGIYLYGFFFEQLVVSLQQIYGISLTYMQALFLSAIPTLATAIISYYLVEVPTQRLSKFLLTKCRHSQ